MKGILATCAVLTGLALTVPLASGDTPSTTNGTTTTTTPTSTTPRPCPKAQSSIRGNRRACGHRFHRRGFGVRLAVRACRAERNDPNFAASHDGKTFAEFYGEHPFRACVKSKLPAIRSASRQCRAERKTDPAAFRAKYGTNADKSNAFGKCVSQKAKLQQSSQT